MPKNITGTPTGRNGLNIAPSYGDETQHLQKDAAHLKPQADKKLPDHDSLVAKSRASQSKGSSGIGHADKSFNDSMAELNHAPQVSPTVNRDNTTAKDGAKSPLNKGGK